MNHIYRLVWSRAARAWIVVAETARSTKAGGKAGTGGVIGALLCALGTVSPHALAAPTGGAITAGSGSIAQSGTTTTITQTSGKLAIDWTSFSTAANEAIVFNQPGASAIALNRVLGSSPSALLGSLTANGQIFILNPNGVLFGANAQVNVGGLVASSLSLGNDDFMAGNYRFSNAGNAGTVINQGTLTAADGGYIALLAPQARNEGVIGARLGTAMLAAGDKITLNLDNGSLLGYSVDQGALAALAENRQLLRADGGQVIMTAQAANALSTAVVNNTGVIEARTLENRGGVIKLLGDMQNGTVQVGGTLDASAPISGDGGFIDTSAAHVKIADEAVVTTKAANGRYGAWLIDPTDFTVANSGGDITSATLSQMLGNNNIILNSTNGASGTQGNVNINDTVSWSADTILSLVAVNNINVNAAITATGASAGLSLSYGGDYKINAPVTLSGANASLSLNGNSYQLIHSMSDLAAIPPSSGGRYALAQDLDASATTYSASVVNGNFNGSLAGLGHSISDLSIVVTNGDTSIGLFSMLDSSATVRDLTLAGGSVAATYTVGALAGTVQTGAVISNVRSSAAVSGIGDIGGLVGYNAGTIVSAVTSGSVTGFADRNASNIGGLVGANIGAISQSSSSSTVHTTGDGYAGGLVGSNTKTNTQIGSISNSFATGSVYSSGEIVGGLVGDNNGGTISTAFATGNVNGGRNVGGLAGRNINGSTITNAWASGDVNGNLDSGNINHGNIGSLLGDLYSGTVSNVVSSGQVTTGSANFFNIHGMVGVQEGGVISNAYFDQQRAGATDTLATGLTTAESMLQASYTTLDFGSTWRIYDGHTTPLLKAMLTPYTVTVTGVGSTKTYDGASAAFNGTVSTLTAGILGTVGYDGAINAGTYNLGGLWSTQYDISYTGSGTSAQLIITPRNISASFSVTKVYDGSADYTGTAPVYTFSNLVAADAGTIGATADIRFGDKNAAPVKTATASNAALTGDVHGNYVLTGVTDDGTSSITPAPLQITGLSTGSRVYDGTTAAILTGSASVSALGNDVVSLDGPVVGAFSDKNVGSGKTVNLALGNGGITLTGHDAGNYQLVGPQLSADITPATVIASGATAANKFYDGTTAAGISGGILTGVIGQDRVSLAQTGQFADAAIGKDKPVTASFALTGADAGNYVLAFNSAPAHASILERPYDQFSYALGDSALAHAYSGALGVVPTGAPPSGPGGNRQGNPQDNPQSAQPPAPQIGDTGDSRQLTPRLNASSCGVQMPDGVAC